MVTVAFVMRQPASAPVNQELVEGSVIDATKMPTIRVEDVLVSKVFHNPSVIYVGEVVISQPHRFFPAEPGVCLCWGVGA